MTIIALLLCIVPIEDVARDRADVLFVEHFYDDQGRLVFDQLVPLEWSRERERYDVICWRLIKCSSMMPERDWRAGGYLVRFVDGEILREIRAPAMREEWGQTDSELAAREVWPKEMRRELSKPAARPR